MKRFLIVLLTLALCMGCCGAFAEEEKVLRIYSWEDYVDADTIAGFSDEYGIDVEFITIASNEEMLLKLERFQQILNHKSWQNTRSWEKENTLLLLLGQVRLQKTFRQHRLQVNRILI